MRDKYSSLGECLETISGVKKEKTTWSDEPRQTKENQQSEMRQRLQEERKDTNYRGSNDGVKELTVFFCIRGDPITLDIRLVAKHRNLPQSKWN